MPALRHGEWGSYESTVLMEYLEDLDTGRALLPKDPKLRAHSRLWCDHINRHIIPAFYKYLQAQEAKDQVKFAGELKGHISTLVDAADTEEPFFLGKEMGFVDVQIAPWVVRLEKVLKPYRGKEARKTYLMLLVISLLTLECAQAGPTQSLVVVGRNGSRYSRTNLRIDVSRQ